MINRKRVVALIPARGGSKTIKNKNLKNLGGKPLIVWSIETALKCEEIDNIIVSTDDEFIKKVALENGADVYDRPPELAKDDSLVIDVIRNVLEELKKNNIVIDILVLLEPTSPLRNESDIAECLKMLMSQEEYDSVATFKNAELNPNRAWRIVQNEPSVFIEGAIPWLPRQKLERAYQLSGAVYAFYPRNLPDDAISLLFGKSAAIIMPEERSIDIDGELDFELAEILIRKREQNEK